MSGGAQAGTLGPVVEAGGVRFTVASSADALSLCLFDGKAETRLPMGPVADGLFSLHVPGVGDGTRYGLRAQGPYDPGQALWFDESKLLLDPYAREVDRAFAYRGELAAPGIDTAGLVPKGVVRALPAPVARQAPRFRTGGLIYELQVRSFSMRHPAVPEVDRGTLRALMHPAVIEHLQRLHVAAVELMPINAWIDERHLAALGLTNAWGYNPVSYFALDPRLAPGGIEDLRAVVGALHGAGIGVILDMVYNHDGESDALGPTLSLRGLDARGYFRHDDRWRLINDTGTGNAVDCNHPVARRLILDSLRYFVAYAGVDGFRFDLAPALGRMPEGFDANAPLLAEMQADPLLADRILIAEPWDIGPGGYQLGRFGEQWLEWNDRYRDDMRRFWRGDAHMLGALATRLAGSADVFGQDRPSRTVNFLAAHDGFSLADVTAYEERHNEANGEQNRDGHGENLSWNGGVEGPTDDSAIVARRRHDVMALLGTLFASRGAIMLTAGDEFGRTQQGNNNAYCQDNAITWLDWEGRDREIEAESFRLAAWREGQGVFSSALALSDGDVEWLHPEGRTKTVADWESAQGGAMAMRFLPEGPVVCFNRGEDAVTFRVGGSEIAVPGRSVRIA